MGSAVRVARLAIAATALLGGLTGGVANACQPEYCPEPPLFCEWGPFAGTCVYPY